MTPDTFAKIKELMAQYVCHMVNGMVWVHTKETVCTLCKPKFKPSLGEFECQAKATPNGVEVYDKEGTLVVLPVNLYQRVAALAKPDEMEFTFDLEITENNYSRSAGRPVRWYSVSRK